MRSKTKCVVKPSKKDNPYAFIEQLKMYTSDEEPSGIKHDNGKRQWALLPWREVGQVVDVLTLGVKKYSADNWMHVPAAERRYFEAAMRHITAWRAGRVNDSETKCHHLAHAICCLLFALWFDNENRRGHK